MGGKDLRKYKTKMAMNWLQRGTLADKESEDIAN